MSEKLRESLSATVDDEADEFELRRVLDEMEKDERLRDTWERYHLIGALMRGARPGDGERRDKDLRDKVWAALDLGNSESPLDVAEPHGALQTDDGGGRSWLGRVTGLGVAATVAFAVIFGIGGFDQSEQAATQVAQSTVSIDGPRFQETQLKQEITASDMQRANAYFLHHVQHKALNQVGVASFVKLVTYETQ